MEEEKVDLLDLQEFDEEALKKESEELLEMRMITAETAVFSRTEGGFVALRFRDREYPRVGVYLTFPLTNPEEYISIREADDRHEISESDLFTNHLLLIRRKLLQ